jgi:glycosyltransferase involved in cell wall biosynthesis
MELTMPDVSILMPMRNAEEYIEESIQSLLNQTFSTFELIVVNDCSDDASQVLVESFSDKRIKIVQGRGEGISSALNLALNYAKGKYVCRCDADDLFPTERLKLQVDWLESHSDYIACSGKFSSMDKKSRVISEFNTGDEECNITQELLTGKTRTHLGTFLVRKNILDALNGFREYFVTAEDIDMQLRLAESGSVGYMPENLYFYRIHNTSITHVQNSNKRVFFEELARTFRKQRLLDGQDDLQKGCPPDVPKEYDTAKTGNQHIADILVSASWKQHGKGKKWLAIKTGLRACENSPLDYLMWRNLIILIVKRSQ